MQPDKEAIMAAFINRQNKSTLFAKIFGSPENKAYTLQLYNAMNGTSFNNPDDLVLTTLETVVYMGMHNDVSFMLDCTMNVYEHQSTENGNMPLRFLCTLSQLYSAYVSDTKHELYREKALPLPAPKCVVFYNGTKEAPERTTMRLSDSFIGGREGDVEVVVHFININKGNNEKLQNDCTPLQEYCRLVDSIREKVSKGKSIEEAVDEAIDGMDDDSVLKGYLVRHRAGVKEIMFDEKSIEEVKEMVDKRINELEGMVANQSEMIKKQDRQLSKQSEMLNEQNSLLKEQEKNLSDAIAYVAKTFGISEKEAQERISSQHSQSEDPIPKT